MGIKTRFKNIISGKDMWTGFRRPYPEIVLGKAEKLTGRISACLM
jgi:beta-phosphoglucomutase-like phosphatase (HAD superfamily)